MKLRRLAAAVFVCLGGAVLVYSIVRHSLPAYLAQDHPEAALRLRPSQPDALIKLVEQLLDPQFGGQAPAGARSGKGKLAAGAVQDAGGQTETAKGEAEVSTESLGFAREDVGLAVAQRMAEKAILADPLNARAFRLLGEIAARQGDEARASTYMKASAQRSLHESGALLALLRTALVKSDYGEAIYDIDALLRVRPQLLPYLVPALAVMSERPEARASVIKLLETAPPWREGFFEQLPRSIAKVETPGGLLLELKDSRAPPTSVEVAAYLTFLASKKLYQEAYGYWVQLLSPEQLQYVGLVYDGNFTQQPAGMPFDWDVRGSTGYTAEVVPGYLLASNRGLNVQFSGTRTEFHPIGQIVMLAPGNYTVKGLWRGTLVAKRGLEWTVGCAETGTEAGSSALFHSNAAEWTRFEFEVSIPADGCSAQKLALKLDARSQSETLADGSIWFSKLEIVQN